MKDYIIHQIGDLIDLSHIYPDSQNIAEELCERYR